MYEVYFLTTILLDICHVLTFLADFMDLEIGYEIKSD